MFDYIIYIYIYIIILAYNILLWINMHWIIYEKTKVKPSKTAHSNANINSYQQVNECIVQYTSDNTKVTTA
jgi:hypothetical protein